MITTCILKNTPVFLRILDVETKIHFEQNLSSLELGLKMTKSRTFSKSCRNPFEFFLLLFFKCNWIFRQDFDKISKKFGHWSFLTPSLEQDLIRRQNDCLIRLITIQGQASGNEHLKDMKKMKTSTACDNQLQIKIPTMYRELSSK